MDYKNKTDRTCYLVDEWKRFVHRDIITTELGKVWHEFADSFIQFVCKIFTQIIVVS